MEQLSEGFVFTCIRPRAQESHKGSYGRLLAVAGSPPGRGAAGRAAAGGPRARAGGGAPACGGPAHGGRRGRCAFTPAFAPGRASTKLSPPPAQKPLAKPQQVCYNLSVN